MRRASGHASATVPCACGRVVLDPGGARVTLDGAEVALTPLEYRAIAYLLHHCGQVISKTELTEHIYGQDFDRDSNVIEVLVNRLRSKFFPELILTRRGLGYQLFDTDRS